MKNQITYFRFTESAKDFSHSSLMNDVKTLKELNTKHKYKKENLSRREKELAKISLDELNKFIEVLDSLFKNLNSIEKFAINHKYNIHNYTKYVLEYVSGKKPISELTDDIMFDPRNFSNKNFLRSYHITHEEYISLKKMENKYILDAVNELKSNVGSDVINNFNDLIKLKKSYDISLIEYNKIKEELSNFKFRERVKVKDMESLNKIIQEMNNKGWVVKQIEGILSGQTGEIYKGGYGYGFTEGIMILWEMK